MVLDSFLFSGSPAAPTESREPFKPVEFMDDGETTLGVRTYIHCWYDSPSELPLFVALEKENWKGVLSYLETGYWPNCFFAAELKPQDQSQTWVSKVDDAEVLEWSQLPLHLALSQRAPPEVIGLLLRWFPRAIKCPDSGGRLPLHLALEHGATDVVIDMLLEMFPVSARITKNVPAFEHANQPRDRLLQAFCKDARNTATQEVTHQCTREMDDLTRLLDRKTAEKNTLLQRVAQLENERRDRRQKLLGGTTDSASNSTATATSVSASDDDDDDSVRLNDSALETRQFIRHMQC